MAARKDRTLLRQLDILFNVGVIRELTDGQLLERFATGTGEAAELAFAALVERHGPMVSRVCRAQLVDHHDTQDAFQATFLILVKKARSLWVQDSLGPWLNQVAFRTASCARAAAARRRRHERFAAQVAAGRGGLEDRTDFNREQMLHAEINRLPERYRVPIVLCDLQGHTCEEAARRMGCPVGTVKSWRSRGRERLRDRLTRLGLTSTAGLPATMATDAAHAAVPRLAAEETVCLAVRVMAQRMTAGEVPASVRMLVSGVLTTMLVSKLRMTMATVIAAAFLAAGIAMAARDGEDGASDPGRHTPPAVIARDRMPQPSPAKEAQEIWRLSLGEAIGLGLENSELVRTSKAPGGGYVVSRRRVGQDVQQFRADVMAHLRRIEELYWSLAQQHAQLWASEEAVELAEQIRKRVESELAAGRSNAAELAEASQRLEQFRLDLTTKTSDVITTERQLRNVLGLVPADNRRILPVTEPRESLLEPDWESCRAAMLQNHPEILRTKAKARPKPTASPDGMRNGSADVEGPDALLRDVVHVTTHSLARFFLEIDANYKQFKTASRLRAAAAQRLEAQRAFYEEGRITIDRYLDAVSQHASAVAQEAQFKTTYNISIVALEEAKGTLLAHDKITVVDGPVPPAGTLARQEYGRKTASPDVPAPAPRVNDSRAPDEGPTASVAGKTFSFQFTVGTGPRPVEVRGSFTITPARPVDGRTVH